MASLTRKRSTPTRSSASSANNNSVLFTIGRMNPPTPGHKKLIQTMMVEALSHNVPIVFVNLTSTVGLNNEGKINPLPCEEKKRIVQKMIARIKDELKDEYDPDDIDALQVIVNCADDKDIKNPLRPNQIPDLLIGMFNKLRMIGLIKDEIDSDPVDFRLYLGEKDYGKFDWLKETFPFYDKEHKKVMYDLKSIKVKRPPGDMSATYLRNLTIENDEKFMEAMVALAKEQGKVLTDKDIEKMTALDRPSVFIHEMTNVGLNDKEAAKLFGTIQSEIKKYQLEASVPKAKTTTTRKKKGGKRRTKRRIRKKKNAYN